jgi:subtilisin family serine protease
MARVSQVDQVQVHLIDFPLGSAMLSVAALGQVNTTGWTHPRLAPWFYVTPPADGIWDFDFVADPPVGIVADILAPTGAAWFGPAPDWAKGARVHAAANDLQETARMDAKVARRHPKAAEALALPSGRPVIVHRLASYDDSIQPTGTIHWRNDGPFGLPTPHVEMKKLHHELVLTLDGPDEPRMRDCLNQAVAAGVIAAIAAAVATGGLALQAAVSAALATLTSCLGAGFQARVDDKSRWDYWDT